MAPDVPRAPWHGACVPIVATTSHRLPSLVRTRIIPAEGQGGVLEQVCWLTPYEAETIAQAARRSGPGTRLEVVVPGNTNAAGLAAVETLFAWLAQKGITVSVQRGNGDG